jgi:hypothetical protein
MTRTITIARKGLDAKMSRNWGNVTIAVAFLSYWGDGTHFWAQIMGDKLKMLLNKANAQIKAVNGTIPMGAARAV